MAVYACQGGRHPFFVFLHSFAILIFFIVGFGGLYMNLRISLAFQLQKLLLRVFV